MDAATLAALGSDQVIDITTTGRKSGAQKRIEIWYHRVAGRYYITGTPGPRNWFANLEVHPSFTFHLKQSAVADLAAHARPITDPEERRTVLTAIIDGLGAKYSLDEWLAGSPLVEVTFDE